MLLERLLYHMLVEGMGFDTFVESVMFDLNPESLKNEAVPLPGEVAVLRSAVSVQQPAELALPAVLRPVPPTCDKGKEKFMLFSNHD